MEVHAVTAERPGAIFAIGQLRAPLLSTSSSPHPGLSLYRQKCVNTGQNHPSPALPVPPSPGECTAELATPLARPTSPWWDFSATERVCFPLPPFLWPLLVQTLTSQPGGPFTTHCPTGGGGCSGWPPVLIPTPKGRASACVLPHAVKLHTQVRPESGLGRSRPARGHIDLSNRGLCLGWLPCCGLGCVRALVPALAVALWWGGGVGLALVEEEKPAAQQPDTSLFVRLRASFLGLLYLGVHVCVCACARA